jgi:hypothetical protein
VIERVESEGEKVPTMLATLREAGAETFYRDGEFLGPDGAWHSLS